VQTTEVIGLSNGVDTDHNARPPHMPLVQLQRACLPQATCTPIQYYSPVCGVHQTP